MTLDTQTTRALLQELLMALRGGYANGSWLMAWLIHGIEELGRDIADEAESEWMEP